MRNVLQRRERRVGESLLDALGHVRTRNRVEHSPDERQRYIGRLEYLRPALGVLAAVLDVADQEMRVLLPVVQVEALPDRSGVGSRVVSLRERRSEAGYEQLAVHRGAYLRPLLRVEQGDLRGLGPVQVRVDAAVHEVERA